MTRGRTPVHEVALFGIAATGLCALVAAAALAISGVEDGPASLLAAERTQEPVVTGSLVVPASAEAEPRGRWRDVPR